MKTTFALTSLLFMACTNAPSPTAGNDEQRGSWKADTSSGSEATCAGHCGGRSPGRCYCDDACSGWGDCCPDYAPVCAAPADMVPHDGGATDLFPSNPPDLGPSSFGDLSPNPSNVPDLSPNPWNAPDLSPVGSAIAVQFSADFQPNRHAQWVDAGTSAPPIHVDCKITGTSASAQVDCGGSYPASVYLANGAGGFMVYLPGGGLLTGDVESTSTVELVSYGYNAPDASYYDQWTGALIVPTSPIP